MVKNADTINKMISVAIPEGSVVTEHNERGHFYRILTPDKKGVSGHVYPSVTGKIQIIKDESLINYKMNQAIQYVFKKYPQFNDANIMEHLDLAARASMDILVDAGDIGTEIHDVREAYFNEWIKQGKNPGNPLDFIPFGREDVRIKSAMRALDKFCHDYEYVPVRTELFVYSHEMKCAGTLDDLGLMKRVINKGDENCQHCLMEYIKKNVVVCVKCDYRHKIEFVLLDIKTSNQFKDHYFFQVALYYWMFYKLTGIRPERCFILKLSKEDGTYKIEDLKSPSMLASYARSMVRTHDGIQFIRSLRKDNQKRVAEKIEL